MHIGYMRYSQNIFLDYVSASVKSGGATVRMGILEAFVKLGHKVTILTKVSPKPRHLSILRGEGDFFDYSFFDNIEYEPDNIPDDLDMIFMESAVANIQFAYDNIVRMKEVFNNYSGQVVYYHHADQLSAFPLGAMMDGEGTNFSLQKGNKEPSYNNIFKDMTFDDKQYILLTNAQPDKLIEKQDTYRFLYSRFDHSIRIPLCYSENFDRMEKFVPIDKRPYDLIYIGHEKTKVRTDRMNELYGTADCCKRLLYGNWKKSPKGWDYRGEFTGQGNIYKKRVYHKARASILTADSWFFDVDMIQPRIKEAIRSWNLALIDNQYIGADKVLGEDFVIADHSDVHAWIDAKSDVIMEAIEYQHSRLTQWTFEIERVLREIESVKQIPEAKEPKRQRNRISDHNRTRRTKVIKQSETQGGESARIDKLEEDMGDIKSLLAQIATKI